VVSSHTRSQEWKQGWLLLVEEGKRRFLASEALTARIRAVEVESMSCRGAAGRFGVAPSTEAELVRLAIHRRRSARIEGHSVEILALSNVITLVEIAAPAIDTFRAEAFAPFGNCLRCSGRMDMFLSSA